MGAVASLNSTLSIIARW